MRRLAPLPLVLLAGCGSMAVSDLPAPAVAPRSPALTTEPAGDVERAAPPRSFRVIKVKTCRDPLTESYLAGQTQLAVLCGRDRTVELLDRGTQKRVASASAGIGPTGMVTDGKDATYVIDSLGEALLVYRRTPFKLIRRVHLGGGPYAIAFDRERWGLWITRNGANDVVFYKAGWRPVIEQTYPSIRDAHEIAVEGDEVTVRSKAEVQRFRAK